jgi:hypothetical protein
MTRRARILAGLCIVVAVLATAASIAWAEATETPKSGTICNAVVLDEGVLTLTDEGAKVRGYVSQEFLDGDLAGYIIACIDGNYTSPGNGDMHGTIEYYPDGSETATFVGRFDGVWEDMWFEGYWVLHGVGEYEGQTMHIHNYGGPVTQWCDGYILDPHGE